MTVPEGIVEKKDLKLICAPPWGTNYEMKAKKNTKQLSYFYDEKDKKYSAMGEKCAKLCQKPQGRVIHKNEGFPFQLTADQNKEVVATDEPTASCSSESKRTEGIGGGDATASEKNFHSTRSPEPSGKVSGSQSVKQVKKTKTDYETSNSAYGLHKALESEADLPKSYRRVSSFSKLYGDKQPLKK